MRKIYLLLALLCLTIHNPIRAYDFEADGYYFNITDAKNHEVEVTYKDTNYKSYSGAIDIPSTVLNDNVSYTVTAIGAHAFRSCGTLLSVNIPNTVKKIGYYAFYACNYIYSLTIGSNVQSISLYAFYENHDSYYSSNDRYISIDKAIWLCNSLPTGVDMSVNMNYVSSDQFNLSNQKVYPFLSSKFEVDNVVYVPVSPSDRTCDVIDCNYAPSNGDIVIDSIVSNRGVQLKVLQVNDYAFYNNDLITSLKISNAGSIGKYAFFDCDAITKVDSSNNGYIGQSAFNDCDALTTATISNNGNIGDYAFRGCDALTTATISNNGYIGQSAFNDCDALATATISNNGNIGDDAFNDCDALTTATISNNGNIGKYAFYDCNALQTVSASNNGSIGASAFSNCSSLNKLEIGDKVTSLGYDCFSGCSKLPEVFIPDNVTSLGSYVFQNCSSLGNVKIGNGIGVIPIYAFSGCSSLPKIEIPANIVFINNYAFHDCSSLADIYIIGNNTTLKLGSNGRSPLFANCPLDEVYIGKKLSYQTSSDYGYSPFYRNTSLRSVKITDAETQIYSNEFYGCSNLQEFECGDGVESIGNWAFSGCSALKSYSSGSNVKTIGQEAFSDCTAMTSFTTLAAEPPVCGDQALDDINKWECTLHVPDESIDEYQAAPQWKEFFFIESSGVEDVVVDDDINDVAPVYYNLQGVRVDNPTTGIYIVRRGNKTTKEYVN